MATIKDLTGTIWVVPAGWSATQKLVYLVSGELSIGDTDYSLPVRTTFTINTSSISLGNGAWDDNIVITPSQSFTITFETVSAQSGYTVEQLISWLETYSEKPTPTDAVTIEYNGSTIASLKAGQSATLECKDLPMLDNVVVTVPENMGGAGEVVEEWDGSYTVSGGTISFTVELIGTPYTYQAESGMTWGEWCGSEYDTGNGGSYRYFVSGEKVCFIGTSNELRRKSDDVYVKPTDIIQSNGDYICNSHGGGSND
jgi:hypothetical protein